MRDGDVAGKAVVDVGHHLAEETPVGGCVTKTIEKDVAMNHLMDDDVVKFVFRQVVEGAETQVQVVKFNLAEECTPTSVNALSEVRACPEYSNGKFRQFTTEYEFVVLTVFLLYVRDGECHRKLVISQQLTKQKRLA